MKNQDIDGASPEGHVASVALPEVQVGDVFAQSSCFGEKVRRGIDAVNLAIHVQVSKGSRYGAGATANFQQLRAWGQFYLRLVTRTHGHLLGIRSPELKDPRQVL